MWLFWQISPNIELYEADVWRSWWICIQDTLCMLNHQRREVEDYRGVHVEHWYENIKENPEILSPFLNFPFVLSHPLDISFPSKKPKTFPQ